MAFKIAVDIGNTRTKIALFEDKEILQSLVFMNNDLKQNNKVFNDYAVEAIIISSVQDEVENDLSFEPNIETLYLNYKMPLPFQLAYESPETLGRDRMAAVAGAMYSFPNQNILVIDAGTCITYDFLTSQGKYLGGAISPGVQLRLQAMNQYTNKLPLINWEQENRPKSIGNTTITSMLSGVINGIIGELNGFIYDYKKQYNSLQIVLTGGDAQFFEKELKNSIFADPNLVLKGLNEILDFNRN